MKKLNEEVGSADLGDAMYAQELLNVQTWYNQEKKRLDDMLAKKRSDAVIKYQQRAMTKNTTAQNTTQKPATGTVDTAGNPVTSKGGTPTIESYSNILTIKQKPLNEVKYNISDVDDDEIQELTNYLDAENISYIKDEDNKDIEFDDENIDDEWKEQLEKFPLDKEEDSDNILSVKDDNIIDINKKIDKEKLFFVKISNEGDEFVGKIYKLFDEGDWRSKLIDGESETFEQLNYDPEWDEFDIIGFLRENYENAELIDEDEYNDHIEENLNISNKHRIPTLNEFMNSNKI
jgi:hypothetical protein